MPAKLRIILAAIILILLFSCDQKPKNPASEYGDALINAYKRSGGAVETALNLDAVEKAVMAYQTTHGVYPQSLDEVRDLIGTPIDTSKYDYNPETGSVSLKK